MNQYIKQIKEEKQNVSFFEIKKDKETDIEVDTDVFLDFRYLLIDLKGDSFDRDGLINKICLFTTILQKKL